MTGGSAGHEKRVVQDENSQESEIAECAVCGEGADLSVEFIWQHETYDYCLDCGPAALVEYRELVVGDE